MESRGRAGIQAPLTFDQFCFWILRLNLFWHPVALPTLDFQHSSASLSLHRGLGLTSSNRHSIASVSLHRGLGLKSSNGHTACCGFGSEGRWLGRHFMNCCELDHYLIIQPFQPFLSQRGLGSFYLKQCFKLNISGLNLFVLPFPSFFFVLLLFAGPTVQVYNPLHCWERLQRFCKDSENLIHKLAHWHFAVFRIIYIWSWKLHIWCGAEFSPTDSMGPPVGVLKAWKLVFKSCVKS